MQSYPRDLSLALTRVPATSQMQNEGIQWVSLLRSFSLSVTNTPISSFRRQQLDADCACLFHSLLTILLLSDVNLTNKRHSKFQAKTDLNQLGRHIIISHPGSVSNYLIQYLHGVANYNNFSLFTTL